MLRVAASFPEGRNSALRDPHLKLVLRAGRKSTKNACGHKRGCDDELQFSSAEMKGRLFDDYFDENETVTKKRARVDCRKSFDDTPRRPSPVTKLCTSQLSDTESRETDSDDEAAAQLLLGMGSGCVDDDNDLFFNIASVPRRKRSSFTGQQPGTRVAANPSPNVIDATETPVPTHHLNLVCTICKLPVSLSGERRPTFVCGQCRSKTGNMKRAQKALLASDHSKVVTIHEALESIDRSCRGEDSLSSKDAERRSLDTSTDNHGRAGDEENDRNSEGSNGGDAHGRCKCGKRIAADHPPCKSELMLLCENFQRRFGQLGADGQPQEIMLKEAVAELKVSRRRLYDIINVLEAVEIVRRTGKLTYEWRGLCHLTELLPRLAKEEEMGIPVEERLKRTPPAPGGASVPVDDPKEEIRTQHTLWALSRKFVRVLLTRRGPLPLTEVATLLMDNSVAEHRKNQTQITIERRLYDIGSILTAVGLIEKTYLGKRQPAFMWKWKWSTEKPATVPTAAPSVPLQHDSLQYMDPIAFSQPLQPGASGLLCPVPQYSTSLQMSQEKIPGFQGMPDFAQSQPFVYPTMPSGLLAGDTLVKADELKAADNAAAYATLGKDPSSVARPSWPLFWPVAPAAQHCMFAMPMGLQTGTGSNPDLVQLQHCPPAPFVAPHSSSTPPMMAFAALPGAPSMAPQLMGHLPAMFLPGQNVLNPSFNPVAAILHSQAGAGLNHFPTPGMPGLMSAGDMMGAGRCAELVTPVLP